MVYLILLAEAVDVAEAAIGAPEEWLSGYFSYLINRQELQGYRQDGCLVATGECRSFNDYQTEYADLGIIVGQSLRGKGLGTRRLQPICSTEKTNLGTQKTIIRAGLFAGNRILQFDL